MKGEDISAPVCDSYPLCKNKVLLANGIYLGFIFLYVLWFLHLFSLPAGPRWLTTGLQSYPGYVMLPQNTVGRTLSKSNHCPAQHACANWRLDSPSHDLELPRRKEHILCRSQQTRASEDKSAKLNSFYVQPLEQFPGSLNSVTKEGHISLLVATQQN